MTWLRRLLGGSRRDEVEVADAVRAALVALPEVTPREVTFGRQIHGNGSVSGRIDVPSLAEYATALRRVIEALADDAPTTTLYLSARLPDGTDVAADALGLPVHPTGADVARLLG